MDILKQIKDLMKRYKYVTLILAVGLLLMLLPEKREQPTIQTVSEVASGPEERLEEILGQIRGVGKVRVLLTLAQGEKTLYMGNEDRTETADSDSVRWEAVVITDGERTQQGLVSQVLPPVYLGAVIVCQGGDQPGVRLDIVEAVCDATGLTADKITVLKMK